MAKLVSQTYAEALFEIAVEENTTSQLLEEATAIRDIIRNNTEFGQFMNHPKIIKEDKITVVKNVFEGKVSKDIVGLIITVIEKDRYSDIDAILTEFIAKVKEYNHIGTAYITTAIALNDNEKNDIVTKLLSTTKYETIDCIYKVDESLIGGMVIKIGDRVVDSSIRTKLEKLERQLLAIQLSN
jgi:F-type H+-transporting ATPase subunit delta